MWKKEFEDEFINKRNGSWRNLYSIDTVTDYIADEIIKKLIKDAKKYSVDGEFMEQQLRDKWL